MSSNFQPPAGAPEDLIVEDDDFLDHPDEFLPEEMIDHDTELFFPLFPNGRTSDATPEDWKRLFEGDASLRLLAPRTVAAYAAGTYSGTGRDTGIANRLRAYGLKVVEIAGWQTRGAVTFHPRGSVDHHTAGGPSGNAPSLNICTFGRSDLPGPLCHVLIGRDNTCYVIAAGRANHAGTGSYAGITGNSNVYGVEHENTGVGNEPWREDQRHTAALVHAALLDWRRSGFTCQHKEWTTRKIDKWDQTGPDMRRRIQNVWDSEGDGEVMFKTDAEREQFVKEAYRDIAGREPESVDTVKAWAWDIKNDEHKALVLVSKLARENRLFQDGRIATAQKRADATNKLTTALAKEISEMQSGSGATVESVIEALVARIQSG